MAGEANIWTPRTLLQLSADTKSIEEKLTATAGQTLFTLKDFTYVISTGALEVHKNGLLLTKNVDWVEQTLSTFSLVIPATAGDQIVATGKVGITGTVDVRDTDIFLANYQSFRDYTGAEITIFAQGELTHGDTGEAFFSFKSGFAIGTFVDNGSTILVPTGGDGSSAWVRDLPYNVKFENVVAMTAYTRHAVGNKYSTGSTFWTVFATAGFTPTTEFEDLGAGLGAFPINALGLKDFGAVGSGLVAGVDDAPAFQSLLDFLTQYSTDTQDSGAFQNKIEIYLADGEYVLDSTVSKSYRNNMSIYGPGKLIAGSTFTDTYLLELIACSHLQVVGLFFEGNNFKAKSAVRISGDGFTGVKRNSTNIVFQFCFFHDFGATGTDSYVVDTLSPNGIPGDFSIDDSSFVECNWLGSFGGALRLASSEIKITGGKSSFMGIDGVNPVINLGNGSSLVMQGHVFSTCSSEHIKADDGASVGRVSLHGCYNETTTKPLYSQSGGTCRMLDIDGGYFSATTDSDSTFVIFKNNCKAQFKMSGAAFQRNGYTEIDLGESGSYIGDMQLSTTSFLSFHPRIKNGNFTQHSMFIQTTQDGNKKRSVTAKYDQICTTKLQLFVGAEDDFTRLRFLTVEDALKYIDQSGYTECELQVPAGTHVIDIPFVFTGDLTIVCAGAANTTLDLQSFIAVKNGFLEIQSATLNYIDKAIQNRNSAINIVGCDLTAATDSIFLVDHFSGDTTLSTCDFKVAGSGVNINNNYRSTGSVNFFATVFTNTNAKASSASTAMCRTKHIGNNIPTAGFWQRGSISEADEVNSGAQMQEINTFAGSPGTWRGTIKVDAT